MNKKLWSILIVIWFLIILDNKVLANDNDENTTNYNNYQDVILSTGKLLRDFTVDDMNTYLNEISNAKMFGYRIRNINENVKATFICSTDYEIYNETSGDITFDVSIKQETSCTTMMSASGSIKTSVKGKYKVLDGSLNTETGFESKITQESAKVVTSTYKVKLEPGSKYIVMTKGDAYITNGVAIYYFFWFKINKGGYEYFSPTNRYQVYEKVSV